MSRGASIRWVVGVIGLVAVVAGVWLAHAQAHGAQNVGWFAYTPVESDFPRHFYLVDRAEIVGAGLAVVGLVLLVGVAAYALGRRRRS